ncbi:MAG: protein kinase, partial [Myxococcales bacterium]|nr:protein kinase [Myxococcales bacterium]
KLTQQGMVLGTPPYMSPEQFTGKELTARSDIYSLGVMAYEMLTGKLPFEANTPWEWATKHMMAQPFPFEDMPTTSNIPSRMKNAIFRALAKNPEDRQESVKAFFEELRGGATGDPSRLSMVSSPAMTPDVGRLQSGTQLGLPLQDPSLMGAPPAVIPGVPPVVPPPAPPIAPGSSGPSKSVLYGLMGIVGLVVLVAGGMLVARISKKDSSTALTLDPNATGDPATVTALPPPTISGLASVTAPGSIDPPSTTPHPTTTAAATATATSKLSGDAACAEAMRQSNSNLTSALAHYQNCSGPQKDSTRRTIAGSIPGAVRSAVNRNDCKGARSIAASGRLVGAAPINVDQQYPQCKGK